MGSKGLIVELDVSLQHDKVRYRNIVSLPNISTGVVMIHIKQVVHSKNALRSSVASLIVRGVMAFLLHGRVFNSISLLGRRCRSQIALVNKFGFLT